MQICISIFWKAMLQIASQHFPEFNAFNFFSVTVKDMRLLDSQREINLVIFHLNGILIHVNILPYSVLNWEYLKVSALVTTLMTVSISWNWHEQLFQKIGALENFARFKGQHFCWKVAGLQPETLLKRRLRLRCFPLNFVKYKYIF